MLAVDIDGAERLLAADLHGEARSALDRVERALRDELRPGDAAVRERDGRLWIIGGGTTLEGARALGRRLANAASNAGTSPARRCEASVGIAVSPDDGTDAASLVAHADEGVFAARAAGVDLPRRRSRPSAASPRRRRGRRAPGSTAAIGLGASVAPAGQDADAHAAGGDEAERPRGREREVVVHAARRTARGRSPGR